MDIDYSKYFPVLDYYEKVVIPINPRRFRISRGKMVCPLHEDHDPSLGIIKKKSGFELCHCFGCNYWGSIIDLHQTISKRYFKKYLEPEESLRDLCRIFDVDFNSLPIGDFSRDKGAKQENELLKSMDDFDIGDLKYFIQQGKKDKRGIGYFNALVMTMVDSIKE